jgi:hypothetical protein
MIAFGSEISLMLSPRAAELGPALQIALLALGLLVPAGLVVWLYRFELQLVRRSHALGLLGLRLLVLLVLWLAVALQPTLSYTHAEAVPSRVCVAVDVSSSMDVTDVQRSADEADVLARALGTSATELAGWSRKEIARRILSRTGLNLLERLGQRHQVELVAFHETRWNVDPAALGELLAAGKEGDTNRATDLRQPLLPTATGSAPLHGILVLTDGRHNHGRTPLGAARQLGALGIPIYPVALGSRRPPSDLLVAEVQAPDKLFKDAVLPITTRIKTMHLPAQELTVEVQISGKPARPEDRHRIKHPGGDAAYEVKFQLPMPEAGTHAIQIRATASLGGEITLANNERTHVVRVVEDKARVLAVDDEARWEFHYLAAALTRDPTVRLDRVLLSPPRLGIIKPDDVDRAGLPRTRIPEPAAGAADPLLDYDCIILGDVPPERLPPVDRERLHRYVADRGGTLIVVAGKRSMPLSYASRPDAANDPLLKLLPIRAPQVLERKDGFSLRLTEDGKRAPFLRLDPDAPAGWPELPSHYWGIIGQRQPGATVLVAPDTVAAAASGLMVHQTYGFGKVVFIGLDSTWRWRHRTGDVYHHRFWGQLVRWAAADRLLPAGDHRVRYGTREPIYAPGQPIELAARFAEDAALPKLRDTVRAKVFLRKADGNGLLIATVPLEANPHQKRLLEGKLRELPPGTYRVELDIAELAPMAKDDAVFTVLADEKGELNDLSTNWDLLQALADESLGRLFTAVDVEQVLALLAQKVQPREIRQDSRPWQDEPLVWWTLGVLVGLLTLEWACRKRLDLP